MFVTPSAWPTKTPTGLESFKARLSHTLTYESSLPDKNMFECYLSAKQTVLISSSCAYFTRQEILFEIRSRQISSAPLEPPMISLPSLENFADIIAVRLNCVNSLASARLSFSYLFVLLRSTSLMLLSILE